MTAKKFKYGESGCFMEKEYFDIEHLFHSNNNGAIKKLPKRIISKVSSFAKRNSLAILGYKLKDRKPLHYCCPNCLRAFLMKELKKRNLQRNFGNEISVLFEGKIGHEGYYLDKENENLSTTGSLIPAKKTWLSSKTMKALKALAMFAIPQLVLHRFVLRSPYAASLWGNHFGLRIMAI